MVWVELDCEDCKNCFRSALEHDLYKQETTYEKVKNKIIEAIENIYYRILGLFKNN